MTRPASEQRYSIPDWDAAYRLGTPPWDHGKPSGELIKVLDEVGIPAGTALEPGCGTGADAVYLARRGFEVTAVDSSPTALERARTRAELAGVNVCFVLDDVFEFIQSCEPFDFVYDSGFYHFIRLTKLDSYVDLLWRATHPGSYCLVLAGSTGETVAGGPPQVSETEIRHELGRLFEFVHIRPFRFESPARSEGYLGWSCLMRRPKAME